MEVTHVMRRPQWNYLKFMKVKNWYDQINMFSFVTFVNQNVQVYLGKL